LGPAQVSNGEEIILLVEDEEIIRVPTGRFLTRHGYRVLVAAGPEEAISISDNRIGKIDLLLTDVIMPGMSGKDLAHQLSVSRPDMRVLYMSGYAFDVIVHQGAVEQGVHLIEKPFSVEALLATVRAVLDEPLNG
jgi:two-component system, cell cycle sensor histidine kinase and response regulator CckA